MSERTLEEIEQEKKKIESEIAVMDKGEELHDLKKKLRQKKNESTFLGRYYKKIKEKYG